MKFQLKLQMKFHFNFQYKFHIKCVSHYTKSASIVFDSSNVKVLLTMISILVVKQMVLRKISQFLSIIVHVKFQVKLRMKFHFNFQYKFHLQCVSHYTYIHKNAPIVFDSSNVKVLLSMRSILVVKQMVLWKISHFLSIIVHVKFQVKLRMKFHFNFQYKFHMQCVSHYTYLHKKCFYCVWFLQCESIIINYVYCNSKADGIKKDFSLFVNNSSREITIEISLQLSILISLEMCLTLHISWQQVLLLCMIPPIWKNYYYEWWVF